jgi:hypothetical protein
MIPAPSPREVFEWFCLAWLSLACLGLVVIVVVSCWMNREKYDRRMARRVTRDEVPDVHGGGE